MLEELRKYKDKLIDRYKRKTSKDDILNTLNLWTDDVKQYYDIINPKVWLWELHHKLKSIKENSSDIHKKFILSLWEKDWNWKPIYEKIINDSYKRIENKAKFTDKTEMVEAKELLEELKHNALKIFEKTIDKLQDKEYEKVKLSWFRVASLIRIMRGDSFCFDTKDNGCESWYIQFDKEYASKEATKEILQYENAEDIGQQEHVLLTRRHVDTWADLDKMKECLLKYRNFISYYENKVKPYVISETWLNDTDFFDYYEKYLFSKWKKTENQKTIRNLNLTKDLSISEIKLFPLVKEWKSYYERRRDFVKDWASSLSMALSEYEQQYIEINHERTENKKKLQEWEAILDLKKI